MRVSVYAYYKFTRHIKDGEACSCVGSLLRFIYSVQETRISETTKAAFAGTATTNEMEEALQCRYLFVDRSIPYYTVELTQTSASPHIPSRYRAQ